jgi:uncharacterized membrane protein
LYSFKKIFFRILIFLTVLIWCAGFSSGLLFHSSNEVEIFSPIFKKIYSSVCHQNDGRTYSIFGVELFVCARCAGIYIGFLIFSLISIFLKNFKIKEKIFISALAAMVTDVILHTTGIVSYSKYFAFATGLFFGSVCFLYILIILENEFFAEE